ncbi:hypothetical protein ACNKHK_18915 [Shigella flexneri]
MMADGSPLLLELNADDPGIFVTQSVHKQQAGFAQPRISTKRITILWSGAVRPHKRLNNAFMLHASTSPFYPLFAALDVTRKSMKASGRRLWAECVALGSRPVGSLLPDCKMISRSSRR